jgi:hypothetical protein
MQHTAGHTQGPAMATTRLQNPSNPLAMPSIEGVENNYFHLGGPTSMRAESTGGPLKKLCISPMATHPTRALHRWSMAAVNTYCCMQTALGLDN